MADRYSGRSDARFEPRDASRRERSRRAASGQNPQSRSAYDRNRYGSAVRETAADQGHARAGRQVSAARETARQEIGRGGRVKAALPRDQRGVRDLRGVRDQRPARDQYAAHDQRALRASASSRDTYDAYDARDQRSTRDRRPVRAARDFQAPPSSARTSYSRRDVEASLGSRRSAKKRTFTIAVVVVLAVVLVGAGAAWAYMANISNNLNRGVDDNLRSALVQTNLTKEPFYMLLLGTDGSAERDGDEEFGGMYRSDSIMLARIDPVDKKVALVSLPRDTKVDLGDEYGEQKLNAAYGLGGPALTVKTVSELADVGISHYAQVDFDGFASIVDALGGVEVDVPVDINDSDAGARAISAGLQTLDGEQALILCRSRNTYAETAAQPDAMRAANQRLVLAAIARKLLDSDIATIANSVQALSQFVTTDLALTDIIGLAQAMEGLDSTTDIYTAAAPTESRYENDIWYDFLDEEAWKVMMARINQGMPPTESTQVDSATGTVIASAGTTAALSRDPKYSQITVKNGTNIQGLAAQTRNVLVSFGYQNVVVGDVNTDYTYPETLVIYNDPAKAKEAEAIVEMIGQGKPLENQGDYLLYDDDFLVLIGENWQ